MRRFKEGSERAYRSRRQAVRHSLLTNIEHSWEPVGITLNPLCDLGVLCVSVVNLSDRNAHHRDTENTEDAQRKDNEKGRTMKRQDKDKRTGNFTTLIAVILGALVVIAVPGTQTYAQNTAGSQMAAMPYDLHFIDMMIMHHREGTAMARLAERKGSTPALKAFATKTADDQEKELLELKKHRDHWYAGAAEMDHSQMMAQMHGGSGHGNMKMDMKMDMQGDMAKLQAAKGKAFDRLFLDMMIPHHQMAIDMSKEAVMKAEHVEIKEMARMTVVKQQREIAEMKRLKGGGMSAKAKAKPKSKAKPKPIDHTMH